MVTTAIFELPAPSEAASAAAVAQTEHGLPDFLKRGIILPFQRDKKSDFANATGIQLILSNAQTVLGTPIGSVRWRTEFGSQYHTMRHQTHNPVRDQIATMHALEALSRWEPRAQLVNVTIDKLPTDRTLDIHTTVNIVDPGQAGVVAAANQTITVST